MRVKPLYFLIITSFVIGLTNEASAATVSFTIFNVPKSLHTYALGINDKGQVVGYYSNPGGTYGFSLVGGALNTIDVAGGARRSRRGPDPGTSMGLRWDEGRFKYFMFENDNFSMFGFPGIRMTRVHGISDNGQIVGRRGPHSFFSGYNSLRSFSVPGTYLAYANGINKNGKIVGWYWDGGRYYGFLFDGFRFSKIDVPNATATYAYGINDSDQIVGHYTDAKGDHGFLLSKGNLKTIDFPKAYQTIAYGINDSGQIVGFYSAASGRHGFLIKGGKFGTLDVPGATSTYVYGVNDSGHIVGYCYYDANKRYRGFVATPDAAPSIDKLDNIALNKTRVLTEDSN